MTISIIAALTNNRVIGKNNDIPWKLPNDMKYFKETTMNRHVIMGRKNWESIPAKYRPLPNRVNWIITRDVEKFQNQHLPTPNTFVVNSLKDAIAAEEVFIIGGGEIYNLALPMANKLYLTEINAEVEGDVFFPEVNFDDWKEVSRIHNEADERHIYEYDFVVYERKWIFPLK